MQSPLQITFHGIEPSEAIEARIRSKVDELEQLHDRISSCRVTIEKPHRSQHKGGWYSVRVDLRVPEGPLVVSRDPGDNHAHEDPYVAIRDAFAAAAKQLEAHASRRRAQGRS
jgi:ribosome-associated translation inhibitor RaiA